MLFPLDYDIHMEKLFLLTINRERGGVFRYLPRRLSNHTNSLSTSSKRKIRRRSKLKKQAESTKTTRDRMRVLVEKNELTAAEFSHKKASHLLDLAQSRLSFFRNKVYQNWNPDYMQQHKRPNKLDVIMDARWWTWNIAFALLPAVLIATFCELRGKPLVEKYRKEQKERQEKQLFSSDHLTSENNKASSEDKSGWPLTVFRNLISTIKPPNADEHPTDLKQEEEAVATERDSSRSITTSPLIVNTSSQESDQVSTEALLRRIEQLELRIGANTPKHDDGGFGQSRIRNRAMADMKSRWEEERKESDASETHGNAIDRDKISEWVRMIKRTVSSVFHESATTNDDRNKVGPHGNDQATTLDDLDRSRAPVSIHEGKGRSPVAQKQAEVETTGERPWWRFW